MNRCADLAQDDAAHVDPALVKFPRCVNHWARGSGVRILALAAAASAAV